MKKNRKKLIVIQKDDAKSREWAIAASGRGIEIVPLAVSPIFAPLFILKLVLSGRRPQAYIARYLNDYPSLGKTIARFLSELLLIAFVKIGNIKLFWICHNVDRESEQNFRRISNFRRVLMSSFATKIFVTDRLLINAATIHFPNQVKKVDFITFGTPKIVKSGTGDTDSSEFLRTCREYADKIQARFLSVLCAGSPGANVKSLHFKYLIDLIKSAEANGYYLAIIVAGRWQADSESQKLLEDYRLHPNIYVFEKYTTFSAEFIRSDVDFYFRGYSDFSVPFTVYEACALRKPILALDIGFLPLMVKKYGLGAVTDLEFSNLKVCFNALTTTTAYKNFDCFISENKWSSLIEKIAPILITSEKAI